MNGVVINRALNGMASLQFPKVAHHQSGVECVRMVIVELAPLLEREVMVRLIVVVVIQNGDIASEMCLQLLRDGGFAAAGSARDPDDDNIFYVSHTFSPGAGCRPSGKERDRHSRCFKSVRLF